MWSQDALDFEAAVMDSVQRLGGIDFARACEADPSLRAGRLAPMLSQLGFDELNPASSDVEAGAAALGVRALGTALAPAPVVARLVANAAAGDADAVFLVTGSTDRAAHADLCPTAIAIDVTSGLVRGVASAGPLRAFPLDPFGVPITFGESAEVAADDLIGLTCVLDAFWVLGALETAKELASAYAVERRQFGTQIASFGAIQWRLADMAVAFAQLHEAAAFGLGRYIERRQTSSDALGLRMQMIETAQLVLTNAHQVLGAIGLCEEHDVTVVDRHVQPMLRRPLGLTQTLALLADRIAVEGFDNLYPVRPLMADADAG